MTTYIELKEKAEQLMREAEAARKAEIGAAIAEIKAKMEAYGITVDDLAGRKRAAKGRTKTAAAGKPGRKPRTAAKDKAAKPTKVRKQVAAKYRNADTGDTWSGRGKLPKWLTALEAAGRKREEFAVTQ